MIIDKKETLHNNGFNQTANSSGLIGLHCCLLVNPTVGRHEISFELF